MSQACRIGYPYELPYLTGQTTGDRHLILPLWKLPSGLGRMSRLQGRLFASGGLGASDRLIIDEHCHEGVV